MSLTRSGTASLRYPPLISAAVALFLVLAVLPSALNLPNTNPATTLEYAPVPPRDADAPPAGNLSSLGLATTSNVTGGTVPVGRPPPVAGKDPRTKRCVGNPPRQTEDPLAPPCVAFFEGDNFGETYQGVTKDEIRILFYIDPKLWVDSDQGGVDPEPTATYVDLAKEPSPDDPRSVRHLKVFQRYFNNRYQTYGRTVHFFAYFSDIAGSDDATPERRRADAADNFARIRPFAVLTSGLGYGNEDAYIFGMTKQGVMSFGARGNREEPFFRRFPGLIWTYRPSLEVQATLFSTYACRQLVPYPVSFSGDASMRGKPRKLGFLATREVGEESLVKSAAIIKKRMEACGAHFDVSATYANSGNISPGAEDIGEAATNIAAFQSRGVTTIVWAHGFETQHTAAASRANYRPEWMVAGDGTIDGDAATTWMDQEQWAHARVVTTATLTDPDKRNQPCRQAISDGNPNYSAHEATNACDQSPFYLDLRQLFTGIQVAGPRLRPASIEEGFRAIPAIRSTDPKVPACFYVPGDYTCVKDGAAEWFDPSGNGCYRMTEGGARYFADAWPRRQVTAKEKPSDPCNAYTNSVFL